MIYPILVHATLQALDAHRMHLAGSAEGNRARRLSLPEDLPNLFADPGHRDRTARFQHNNRMRVGRGHRFDQRVLMHPNRRASWSVMFRRGLDS